MGFVRITNETRDTVVAERLRVAGSLGERTVGLLRTDEAELGDGILIERAQSIHMFFMRYAIDVVFVDRSSRVTKIVETLRPWRAVLWARGARDCLELPVGRVASSGTQVGDLLRIESAGE
jgi:uncharacterized protein